MASRHTLLQSGFATTVASQEKATQAEQDRLGDIVAFNGRTATRMAGNDKARRFMNTAFGVNATDYSSRTISSSDQLAVFLVGAKDLGKYRSVASPMNVRSSSR
jgi:hypothetical protein